MSHIVFNSFPRSGNVYLSNLFGRAFILNDGVSAVHIPEIFQVKEITNISIFREPAQAIASLINKAREHTDIVSHDGKINKTHFDNLLARSSTEYIKYVDFANRYFDNIHIVPFSLLSSDPASVVNMLSSKLSLEVKEDYAQYLIPNQSEPRWSDKYDGHFPRPKDEARLQIEELVQSSGGMEHISNVYSQLISRL